MSDLTKRLRGRIVTTIFSVGDSDREWKTEKLKTPDALLVEAADHIDAQDAKIEQLEAALREILDETDENEGYCTIKTYDKARALIGEA